MINLKCKLRQLRYDVRYLTMNYPPLYLLLTKFGDGYGTIADSETDIVIEGFPRSANTFAFQAFKLAQAKPLQIAHHKHSITQFLIAYKFKIPTILLIRCPQEAVISFVIREPCISLEKGFKYWIYFHEKLMTYNQSFVTVTFEEVTTDFGKVIKKVNQHFNTQFEVFSHTNNNVNKCFENMESFQRKINNNQLNEQGIPRPSLERKERKEELLNELHNSSKLKDLINKANDIYYQYLTLD